MIVFVLPNSNDDDVWEPVMFETMAEAQQFHLILWSESDEHNIRTIGNIMNRSAFMLLQTTSVRDALERFSIPVSAEAPVLIAPPTTVPTIAPQPPTQVRAPPTPYLERRPD